MNNNEINPGVGMDAKGIIRILEIALPLIGEIILALINRK